MLQINVLFLENGVVDIGEDFFDGGAQYLIDEISEGSIGWRLSIHQIHKSQIDFTVVLQFSQRAVPAGHESEEYGFQHVDRIVSETPCYVSRDLLQILLNIDSLHESVKRENRIQQV